MLEALLLGLVQGLTEFLPVSSSGHLELVKHITGKDFGDSNLFFTVLLHAGTALSTIVVFRKYIAEVFQGLFSGNNASIKFALAIIISMIPAAFVGLMFEDLIEQFFLGNILLVGTMLLLTAGLLMLSQFKKEGNKELSYLNALVVGVAQAVAILPGISRSGATIATSLILGMSRETAARFSFLMVIPLIFGKMAKDLLSFIGSTEVSTIPVSEASAGFLAAFGAGILACTWMIQLVKRSKLAIFAFYCLVVGCVAIAYGI